MPRYDIPDDLGTAFSVAAALARGVGEKRLRGVDLDRPFRGIRALRSGTDANGADSLTPWERRLAAIEKSVREYALRMPEHEFFSHQTAALLWRAPLPPRHVDSLRSDGGDRELLHVSVLAPHRLPRGAGVRGHEARPQTSRVVTHPGTGLRLASPATTWAMLGGVLRHPYDLIAVGDHMIRVPRMPGAFARALPPPLAVPAQLQAALFSGRRVGKPALRDALPRLRTGSSSRPESWMRVTVVDGGLPEPEIDVDVYAADGRFIGCVDGAYVARKIALEYEGDHHRTDPATWNRDIQKHDDLVAHGWRVIRVTREMLFVHPEVLLRRVADAIRDRS
ncbi:MAG TPA: hypothetical protein VEX42_01875 [Microbacterium sp.]|nr:hypothetical protein [Microbacterium sp.]